MRKGEERKSESGLRWCWTWRQDGGGFGLRLRGYLIIQLVYARLQLVHLGLFALACIACMDAIPLAAPVESLKPVQSIEGTSRSGGRVMKSVGKE